MQNSRSLHSPGVNANPGEHRLPESLGLSAIDSRKSIVVLRSNYSIISEHNTTPEAVKALLRFVVKFPNSEASIFRRIGTQWVRY